MAAPGHTMAVSAAPGSGKTKALREWGRGQPDQRILFLAFSKSVQIQQERNFAELANVELRTIHSIAYDATMTQRLSLAEFSKTAVKDACNQLSLLRTVLSAKVSVNSAPSAPIFIYSIGSRRH